jgi:hypothetical protein
VVWPGYGSLRLWRQSCELLNLDSQTLARTRSVKEKYFWSEKTAAQSQPVPIAAVLELIPSNEPPLGLERVTGREILKTYFHQTFRFPLVRALGCQTPHFRHAARLAASVPTYRLRASRQFRPERLAVELEKLLMEIGWK